MEPLPDIDPSETQEWLDALDSVLTNEGNGTGALFTRKAG